jgi:hypothetical protein
MNSIEAFAQAFAQGARFGHLEGKDYAGAYVIGEEIELSYEAASNQALQSQGSVIPQWWASGYRFGYRLALEGEELPKEYEL